MQKKNKRVFHLYVDSDLLDTFQRLYPYVLTKFCERCMKIAVQSEKDFDNLFYKAYNNEVQ